MSSFLSHFFGGFVGFQGLMPHCKLISRSLQIFAANLPVRATPDRDFELAYNVLRFLTHRKKYRAILPDSVIASAATG
jgi:hypothetical protein